MSICESPSIGRRAVQEIETQRKQAKDSTLACIQRQGDFPVSL